MAKRKTRGVSRAVAVGGLDCRDGDMVPAPAEAMRARFSRQYGGRRAPQTGPTRPECSVR